MRLCFRVPRLTSGADLTAVAGELATSPAALVIVDPLYLAVGSLAPALTCTPWAPSCRPSKASASRRGRRWWW